jgi:hypothetical protein
VAAKLLRMWLAYTTIYAHTQMLLLTVVAQFAGARRSCLSKISSLHGHSATASV